MQNDKCKMFNVAPPLRVLHLAGNILHFAFPLERKPIIETLVIALAVIITTPFGACAKSPYEITSDVVYGHKAGMAMTFDVIRPEEQNGAAVLFMMSGGWFSGWVPPEAFMNPDAPFGLKHFRELVERGYTVFIVRHGSAPQFKVPEAVADVRRAVRYIRLNAKKFRIEPDRIGVCGASAGGHLSLMLGTSSDEGVADSNDPVEKEPNRIAAVVAYFAPVDLREWVGPSEQFPALEFDPKLAESVSPLLQVTPDDAPTLLIHGDKDELVKLDNSQRILSALQKAKVPSDLIVMEGAGHHIPGEMGDRASKALVDWFEKYLASDSDGDDAETAAAGR